MKVTRYELRLYSNDFPERLLAYVPFETEQEAIDYFNNDEEMKEGWALYLVTYTPNSDHARFIRRLSK